MKNTRFVASILLTALLCVSLAYWALKLIRPVERPLAAPQQARPEINLDAAAGLFGGRSAGAAVTTNFQLRGVIDARSDADSVAIIAAAGKPAQAVAVGGEVAPGVIVKEVHPRYVLLSENGVSRRIELPENIPPSTASASPVATLPAQPVPATPQSGMPTQKALSPASQTPAQSAAPQRGQPGAKAQPASSSRASRRSRQATAQAGMQHKV